MNKVITVANLLKLATPPTNGKPWNIPRVNSSLSLNLMCSINIAESKHTRIEHNVSLRVESEEGLDSLVVDEEAVEFIKQLLQQQHIGEQQQFMNYSQSKIIRIESNEYSDLEKKYRIEG